MSARRRNIPTEGTKETEDTESSLSGPGLDRRPSVASLAFVFSVVIFWGTLAHADDVCDPRLRAMPVGAVPVSLDPGQLGAPRRACPRDELAFGSTASLVVDTDDFYGDLTGSIDLAGSVSLLDFAEAFATLELLRYETVISSVVADSFGLGHLGLGLSVRGIYTARYALATEVRLVVPTATSLYSNARPLGVDVGVNALFLATSRLRIHGALTAIGEGAISDGPSDVAIGAALTAGASLEVGDVFSPVLELRVEGGRRDTLDLVAIATALRFAFSDHAAFELGFLLPLAGDRRELAGVTLRGSGRF